MILAAKESNKEAAEVRRLCYRPNYRAPQPIQLLMPAHQGQWPIRLDRCDHLRVEKHPSSTFTL